MRRYPAGWSYASDFHPFAVFGYTLRNLCTQGGERKNTPDMNSKEFIISANSRASLAVVTFQESCWPADSEEPQPRKRAMPQSAATAQLGHTGRRHALHGAAHALADGELLSEDALVAHHREEPRLLAVGLRARTTTHEWRRRRYASSVGEREESATAEPRRHNKAVRARKTHVERSLVGVHLVQRELVRLALSDRKVEAEHAGLLGKRVFRVLDEEVPG